MKLVLIANAKMDMKELGEGSAEKDVEMESICGTIQSIIMVVMMETLKMEMDAIQIVGLNLVGNAQILNMQHLFATNAIIMVLLTLESNAIKELILPHASIVKM